MVELGWRDMRRAFLVLIAFGLAICLASTPAAAQAPAFLVKDINAVPIVQSSDPGSFVTLGSETFFAAFTPSAGRELWKTDGTPAGTVLVKDIRPGSADSSPVQLVVFDGAVFFQANGPTGPDLWRSDGTDAGTTLVKDIVGPGAPGSFKVVGPTLYFTATDGAGLELWKSDGTTPGTMRVKDINPGAASSDPRHLVDFGGSLFFQATEPETGSELWTSDGTDSGTTLVKDIDPLGSGSPDFLTVIGGTLLFRATDSVAGYELWSSDGSALGTNRVKDIRPGAEGSIPQRLTAFGGLLLFTADDGAAGEELWSSDGTEIGTVLVKDINPGPVGSGGDRFTVVGSTMFFDADDGSTGLELWKTDGTETGTALVLDINPGTDGSFPDGLIEVNGSVLFHAFTAAAGRELWISDGIASGTTPVADICPGACTGIPFSFPAFAELNGALLFRANDGVAGNELWTSDGTTAGTQLLANIAPDDGTPDGLPLASEMIDLDGQLLFTATDGIGGIELWRSDGSAAGTTRVKDINPGSADAFPLQGDLTKVGSTVFFGADDGVNGTELWRSDGSEAGTVLVRDIRPGSASSINAQIPVPFPIVITAPPFFAGLGSDVLFQANDGTYGWELWRSDGTAGGTSLVLDIGGDGFPSLMTNVGGIVYLRAVDGAHGVELWSSDGTTAGTGIVKDIEPLGDSDPDLFTDIDGALFFRVADRELWRSDGTETGTVQIFDFYPFGTLSIAGSFVEAGGFVFFAGTDFSIGTGTGAELWRTDGTQAGTTLVKDIRVGTQGSFPNGLIEYAGKLVFTADDGAHGYELWTSDGTAAQTALIKDIEPGPSGAGPFGFVQAYGRLFFTACDSVAGCEVWESDATEGGTHIVADVMPGPVGSNPGPFVASRGYLFFPATVSGNSGTGRELWSIPVLAAGACGDAVLNLGEECDDGNTIGGDCCAADCGHAAPSGTVCDDGVACTTDDVCDANGACRGAPHDALCDDANLCTVDTCNASNDCTHAARPPAAACRTARHSALNLRRDAADATHDRFAWRWTGGEPIGLAEMGDPTVATDYAVCIYDGGGSVFGGTVPADSTRWQAVGDRGFNYSGGAGIESALLRVSTGNSSRARLRGRGAALPDPSLPFTPPVTVQLINSSTPLCLESVFGAADLVSNDATKLRARTP